MPDLVQLNLDFLQRLTVPCRFVDPANCFSDHVVPLPFNPEDIVEILPAIILYGHIHVRWPRSTDISGSLGRASF